MNLRPPILFAEDSENDMVLIQLGFEKARFPFPLHFVSDGVTAMEYLSGKGPYGDRLKYPSPFLLLTDLKMPRMDGFELLSWIRSQEEWMDLPVIVITGSNRVEDRQRAMDLGANSYVLKELLMRPPPTLFEAILRYAVPVVSEVRRTSAQRVLRVQED